MTDKSSIDPEELEKFNRLSQEWWNKRGKFKVLHQINPVRLQYITSKLRHNFNNQKDLTILDIGCGGGLVTAALGQAGWCVTGIDASSANISAAQQHATENGIQTEYLCATVEELVKENKTYDIILCLEVVEHVANISEFISNISKLLNESGAIVLSTFNRTIKSYLLGVIAAEYILNLVPRRTHEHAKFLKPSELYHLLHKNDLHIEEFKGLTFNILQNFWEISDDISVNYFAYATKKLHQA